LNDLLGVGPREVRIGGIGVSHVVRFKPYGMCPLAHPLREQMISHGLVDAGV
jgi:hypothetical protein